MAEAVHTQLSCGVELAVLELPLRRAVASEIRVLTGVVNEPADKLGLAHLVEQTVDKGTQNHTGRELQDEFDKIGSGVHSWCGKQSSGFTSLCLPEYFNRNMELHAEFLRTPTFPQESCDVAIELAKGGMIKGLASQVPYDQGITEANAAMGSLLGKELPPFLAYAAVPVIQNNVLQAWDTVFHLPVPDDLKEACDSNPVCAGK